jgi:ArsR family transcriptional regulator, lead/cadmium/zinc/bismuth-responsive transcriptional repressor
MCVRQPQRDDTSYPPKPALRSWPLITPDQASELAAVFKILAHATRPRLVHALVRAGDLCVSDLVGVVDMTPQRVPNQLQRLVHQGIHSSRRSGNHVCYRLIAPCVTTLLNDGLCPTEDAQERMP